MPAPDTESLSDRILILLKVQGSLKTNEIADSLQCSRQLVDQALYGALKGRVSQDKTYRWTVDTAGEGEKARGTGASGAGRLAALCRYYLDCVAQDSDQGCSVFASNKDGKVDYSVLKELPDFRAGGKWAAAFGESAQELVQRTPLDRSVALYVGYPVLLRYHRTDKWEGYFVEPILLHAIEKGEDGVLQVADDVPTLNFKALSSLGNSGNVLDDVVALSDELGLLKQEELPELEEIALRLQHLRSDWPWIDSPVLKERKNEPELASIGAGGIYNYAVLTIAQRPNYTQGLEIELKELCKVSDDVLNGTALGQWVAGGIEPTRSPTETSLIELIKLNAEQRAAVRSALNAPLTVITGPPGTGKSQVVTALLANCAWQGKRVLFASKNNKAVDVVEQRVNALSARPTLIRLGSRQYEGRLAEFLVGLLSATADLQDRSEYDHATENAKRLEEELKRLSAAELSLIQARNTVDTLESRVEEWRSVFGDSLGHLKDLDGVALSAVLAPLEQAIVRADPIRPGLFPRLWWSITRSGRFKRVTLLASYPKTLEALRQLQLALPAGGMNELNAQEFIEFKQSIENRLSGLEEVQRYLRALKALSELPSLEVIAQQRTGIDKRKLANALDLWQSWARLQPARLSKLDRQSLGQYRTLLEVVLDSNRARVPVPLQSWRQYQALVPKIEHLIPCWAVTSLSAHGKVPFLPGFFDLLVIDEASQCDIASVLPLLYRAKRVVVIGDPQQLTHITQLSPREDSQLQQKNRLPAEMGQWSYAVNSLFALASTQTTGEAFVALRDHHRSHADIIEFSNREFYEGRLRVATRYDQLQSIEPGKPAVQWFSVQGECIRPAGGSVINEAEALAVVQLLQRLLLNRPYQGTISVVSPFRAQANRIREIVTADEALSDRLARMEFISETAHQFQGDERDVMIFSPVVSRGIARGSLEFLRKNGNLFNVAITRARAELYVVGDKEAACECGVSYLAAFAKYTDELENLAGAREKLSEEVALGPEYPTVAKPELVSEWEKVFYRFLFEAGIRAIPQYAVDNYVLDLAVIEGERRLNIEVDGERYHRAWDGELMRRDRLRNQRMMELGWDVKRFWVYQIRDQMEWCVGEVKRWVAATA